MEQEEEEVRLVANLLPKLETAVTKEAEGGLLLLLLLLVIVVVVEVSF